MSVVFLLEYRMLDHATYIYACLVMSLIGSLLTMLVVIHSNMLQYEPVLAYYKALGVQSCSNFSIRMCPLCCVMTTVKYGFYIIGNPSAHIQRRAKLSCIKTGKFVQNSHSLIGREVLN
ncbi:hypothetical protein CMV_025219 [Castanea mollissima]|uniref:Uncharacterized protein n=1 Tax=Castanea mollissima TaxID=60419 RepID=A0A8J4QQ64_9ROSI|nr:hypothetical protein CMV_025219 [Castanea mollissima]